MIFNLVAAIEGDASRFLQAEYKTYRTVFPRVFLFKINSDYKDAQLQNLIIVACKEKNSAPLASDDAEISNLLNHLYKKDFSGETEVLTDEVAPVEYYNSFAQSSYRPKN